MRVLFIRLSSMGDVVLTSGIFKALKNANPDLEIHFMTAPTWAPLCRSIEFVDHYHLMERKPNSQQKKRVLQKLPPIDLVVDWQGSPLSYQISQALNSKVSRMNKQSLRRRWFVKTGWGGSQLNQHVVEKYYLTPKNVLKVPEVPIEDLRPELKLSSQKPDFKELLKGKNDFVAIHPYASQKNKEWPYFEQLCDQLIALGRKVVVLGTSSESIFKDHPSNKGDQEKLIDLTNETNLEQTMDILSRAKVVVSTDSGPFHLGVALKRPTLGLFGPTTVELGFMAPFKKTLHAQVTNLNCRPCHVHGGQSCPKKHFRCMKDLTVNKVMESLSQFLD